MEARFLPVETGAFSINPQYRQGHAMSCPDCGGSQWIVGRVVAECARCEALLPLATPQHRAWIGRIS